MTAHRDLKNIIRDRMAKTGESYSAARVHVMRASAELQGLAIAPPPAPAAAETVEAIVLKANEQSARVRIPGEEGAVTFRSSGAMWRLVPGHLATLTMKRRWTHRGHAYASGTVAGSRFDVAKLGLVPLPLADRGMYDFASSDPVRRPDPYAPLWRRLTRKPRPCFEMHEIAWGASASLAGDVDAAPVSDAAELARAGDVARARELLMDVLAEDLRCLDAHAHLGNLAVDRSPAEAMAHYEIGLRIGELSLEPGFDGLLPWGMLYNRPFLRCMHGYGLCLWRLGRLPDAEQVFARMLSLNPNDNQGARFCWDDVRNGRTWEEARDRDLTALH